MDMKKALDTIRPYLPLFAQCIDHGWNQWKTEYASKHIVIDPRARAAIVYCEIKQKAEKVFDSMDDVVLRTRNGSLLLYIGDDILVRFKKLRKGGRASNIMTGQQRSLYGQIPIPGFLPGNHFNAGYILDDLQQSIERKAIAYQHQNRVVWMLDLNKYGVAENVTTIPATTEPTLQRRVRPRDDKKIDTKKETAG